MEIWPVLYLAGSLVFSVVVGGICISKISDNAYLSINQKKIIDVPYHWIVRWVGYIERLIITLSIVFQVETVVGLWIVLKAVHVWREWDYKGNIHNKILKSRATFNVYLIGTAFSLLYGGVGAQLFFWFSVENTWYVWYAIASMTILVIISNGFIRSCKKKIFKMKFDRRIQNYVYTKKRKLRKQTYGP